MQKLRVTLSSGHVADTCALDEHTALKFEVLPSGALLVFNENMNAAWNVASYSPGCWQSVAWVAADDSTGG